MKLIEINPSIWINPEQIKHVYVEDDGYTANNTRNPEWEIWVNLGDKTAWPLYFKKFATQEEARDFLKMWVQLIGCDILGQS